MNSSSPKSLETREPSNSAERVEEGLSGLGDEFWFPGVLAPEGANGEEESEREIGDVG